MAYLVAGPLIALIGIGAVFFVFRRKAVDQRSMYSARRSQIEHKVRAARQRTLTPHGHTPKQVEQAPAATMDQQPVPQTMVWEAPAYEAPPVVPPSVPAAAAAAPAEAPPWEQPSIPATAPAPSSFDYPAAQPEPFAPAPEPFRPAPEPTPMPPSEPVWTPAPAPMPPAETVAPAASAVAPAATSTSVGGWSIVTTEKEPALADEPSGKRKDKGGTLAGAWSLASGEAPGMDADDSPARRPSGTIMAVAQYAVLVVGLVMVLIGVLVMVANSHVT
ncbi:MAG TPA: hypothetical protein VFR33_06675 [Candidatus Dormibacteraeota bacterium]|nr:hypothetical protein [Candidatus Dormibacteraeota bacterium]